MQKLKTASASSIADVAFHIGPDGAIRSLDLFGDTFERMPEED